MKYISIGAVTKPSTEHIVYVSHCGYDYTLTGEQAALWLDGRYGFDAARRKHPLGTAATPAARRRRKDPAPAAGTGWT